MGGAVSTGLDNDDLIDNLKQANYIKSTLIERVFRAVDRAEYFLPDYRINAYKDLAWKNGNIHISAPCIYSVVMENLKLGPGLSFLNVGSGTGYLSTMVGLVIGAFGTNHGIEMHADVLKYAYEKLAEFKKSSAALDCFEFCEPTFVQGNGLLLPSELSKYDRVYCGAACPENHENYMKNLIKVGGVLVMPHNDQLLQITRVSQTQWDQKVVLPVSFSILQLPNKEPKVSPTLPKTIPISLQAVCRSCIRRTLRSNAEREHPQLTKPRRRRVYPRKKRALSNLVIPFLESSDDEAEYGVIVPGSTRITAIFEMGHRGRLIVRSDLASGNRSQQNPAPLSTDDDSVLEENTVPVLLGSENNGTEEVFSTDNDSETEEQKCKVSTIESVVSSPCPGTSSLGQELCSQDGQFISTIPVEPNCISQKTCLTNGKTNSQTDENVMEDKSQGVAEQEPSKGEQSQQAIDLFHDVISVDEETPVCAESTSDDRVSRPSVAKREKFDSGMSEEMVTLKGLSSEEEEEEIDIGGEDNSMEVDSDFDSLFKVDQKSDDEGVEEDWTPEPKKKASTKREKNEPEFTYTAVMKDKIKSLPLPPMLKSYLNYDREF